MGKAVIAIHGGAGAITRSALTPERERQYVAALSAIVDSGQKMLAAGASALDTVTEAVRLLEECPLFNAGIGSVFTRDATHELDACVMDGNRLQAGAVAGVKHLRNPVLAARLVLEQSPHVLLIGEGRKRLPSPMAWNGSRTICFRPPSVYSSCNRPRPTMRSCSIIAPRRSMSAIRWGPSGRWRWIWPVIWRRRPRPAA
jgi:beta-aspartyl-peptidase (threonine type)